MNSYGAKIEELPSKQFRKEPTVEFPKMEEPTEEVNLFELLRQQAKKKVQKREINRINRLSKDSDIFQ